MNEANQEEDYIRFLSELLLASLDSKGSVRILHPLLEEGIDKLDNTFATFLRLWIQNESKQPNLSSGVINVTVAMVNDLCKALQEFPRNKQNNLEIAISAYETLIEAYVPNLQKNTLAVLLNNLSAAYCDRQLGNPNENLRWAITAGKNALSLINSEESPKEWARIQDNLGSTYAKQKNFEKAVHAYNLALTIYNLQKFPQEWAGTQNNLGLTYAHQGDLAKAIQAYTAALSIYEDLGDFYTYNVAKFNLGSAYRKQGDFKKAMETYKEVLKYYKLQRFPEMWAQVQSNLGGVYFDYGKPHQAIKYFQKALRVFQPKVFPAYSFKASSNLGNAAFNCGYWEEAIQGYSCAISAVENLRVSALPDEERQEIFQQSFHAYSNIVQAFINLGKFESALEYAEKTHCKRLLDFITSSTSYTKDPVSSKVKILLEKLDLLQQQIDQERAKHFSEKAVQGSKPSTGRALDKPHSEKIASLENEKHKTWKKIRQYDPVLASQIQVETLSVNEIQELIDQPTTAILSFFTTIDRDTHIFVVRQSCVTLHTCPNQGIDTLHAWIIEIWLQPYFNKLRRWQTQTPSFLAELAQRLHLGELIDQHLAGIEEIILVPNLLLHQIPFAALPIKDGEYLGDRFLIRHIPSCQILQLCQNRPATAEPFVYGLVENATDDLPCAGFEGAQLSERFRILDEHRLKGSKQATVESFRQLAKAVNVLHCSHHAQSRLDNSLHSELILADGSITLGQLLTPEWRLPQLSDVFLSCCETHLGTPTVTDDILTLATGFLCAGARSVISTLWLVDDLATALFSTFYYEQRQQGCDRPTALSKAQKKLRLLDCAALTDLFNQVESDRQQLKEQRDQQPLDSASYLELNQAYQQYGKVATEIYRVKNLGEAFPFAHPFYWAGFICQGLP